MPYSIHESHSLRFARSLRQMPDQVVDKSRPRANYSLTESFPTIQEEYFFVNLKIIFS